MTWLSGSKPCPRRKERRPEIARHGSRHPPTRHHRSRGQTTSAPVPALVVSASRLHPPARERRLVLRTRPHLWEKLERLLRWVPVPVVDVAACWRARVSAS